MKIIISPAKNMKTEEILPPTTVPVFRDRAQQVVDALKALSSSELQALWACNDRIASLNCERLRHMDLARSLSPAILAYDGIQYKYMAPGVFNEASMRWIGEHLRILSALYGILRPTDGVVSYRLEMQAGLSVEGCKNLYDFWGDALYRELTRDDSVILNLASKEYSRCIEAHLRPSDRMIDCIFAERVAGRLVQKGTLAKMARGEMVRFLAENDAAAPKDAQAFDRLGYRFAPEESSENRYVFLKA